MIYNKEQIMEIIPHRDPMLLIDSIESIEEVEGKTQIVGKKTLTGDESFFKGHFPDYPVMPGVLILEALAQTGAVHVLSMPEYKGKIAFFAGADNVKWKKMVVPGDILTLEVTEDRIRHGIGKANACAYVNGEIVCTAQITVVVR